MPVPSILRYGKRNETAFTRSSLSSNKFYYGDSDYGDYDLDELSFVADQVLLRQH